MKRILSTKSLACWALALGSVLLVLALGVSSALASENADAEPGHAVHAAHPPPPINWIDFRYGSKNVHGGKLEKDQTPMAPPLGAAFFNFLVFAGLLVWKGGPPIMNHIRNKHTTIKTSLEEAAKLRAEAREKLAEYDKRIANVDSEVDALIKGIQAEADADRKRLSAQAEEQAAALKKDAEARIEAEITRARIELERDVIAAAIAAAEKVIRDKASPADQKDLVDTFISGLAAAESAQPEERS